MAFEDLILILRQDFGSQVTNESNKEMKQLKLTIKSVDVGQELEGQSAANNCQQWINLLELWQYKALWFVWSQSK